MVTRVTAPAPLNGDNSNAQGYCSQCDKIWTLTEGQGICRWCGKLANCQTSTTKPRQVKSSSRRKLKQANGSDNGYDQLPEPYLTYYKVASRFAHKAKAEDTQDLLHDIIVTLATAERNNGHKPFTEAVMYRIASRTVADYWRSYYKASRGLNCGSCSQKQRRKCREDYLYTECPKAVKLESINKPIIDSEGNTTELGELIADDKAIDLGAWIDARKFLLGFPQRLLGIAHKMDNGEALTNKEHQYLWYWRKREQKSLIAT
ncbi:MAG: hypothetical protein PHU08_02560 [Dehalococcoidales bacterium]|nr:hypothetical protein [Dehalococcoidales bacterium]